MALIKTKEEIELIREGGQIMHRILHELAAMAKPGVSTWELDQYAEKAILKAGGTPAFKGYGGPKDPFPGTLCTSVNDAIVHGVPRKDEILKEGDIIGLDIGMKYKGLYTDTAITVAVGKVNKEVQKLLDITREALSASIKKAKVGNHIGDIAAETQRVAEKAGFNVVRSLVGHGVGHEVHEEPHVPCYGKPGTGPALREGMVLAIEPMVTVGHYDLTYADDGQTIVTKDHSLGAHFEHTVAITKKGPQILT